MELIGMSAWVTKKISYFKDEGTFEDCELIEWIENYLLFIQQPLELWMFIPCDKEGNVLEEPQDYHLYIRNRYSVSLCNPKWLKICEQYQEAKERVIFEDISIEFENDGYIIDDKKGSRLFISNNGHLKWDIESLIEFYTLTITPQAIEKYNLK